MKWTTIGKIGSFILIWMLMEDIWSQLYDSNFDIHAILSIWFSAWLILRATITLLPLVPLLHFSFNKNKEEVIKNQD